MRPTVSFTLFALVAVPLLGACQFADNKEKADETAATTSAPASTEAAKASPTVETAPAPAPAQPVIQSQPGPNGITADLNKVQVTGNVLTVQVTIKGGPEKSESIYMKSGDVSVIDDATSQRYGILKGADGKYLASPISTDTQIGAYVSKNESEIFWFKFPAPPATATTVSINLPGIAPFDGVAVTR